MEKKQKLEKKI